MVQIHWKLPFSSSGTANIQALTCEARKPEGNSGTFYLAKLLFHSHSRRVLASQILVYWIRIGRRVVAYSKPIWPGSAIMRLPVSLFQWLLIERRRQWNIPWINSSYFRLRGPPPPPPLLPIMFRLTKSQNSWSDHLIRNWSRVALEGGPSISTFPCTVSFRWIQRTKVFLRLKNIRSYLSVARSMVKSRHAELSVGCDWR